MSRVNENIEQMIVRSLDERLSSDEEHELNRALIRDPNARAVSDDYRAMDQLSATALTSLRKGRAIDVDAIVAAAAVKGHGGWRFHRGWLMIPGAIAAALLASIVPRPALSPLATRDTVPVMQPSTPALESGVSWPVGGNGLMRPVGSVPRVRNDTGREVIGVVGEDGNLYWIEVERTRTIRIPASPGGARSALDSL